ncbi:glycosyltransferase family 4 protein [Jiangella sp. DSM 45060]|uniref:glycosyltransferase family 4 protein n=1 Tax=Jiangella sp. DSM 45060 TaxID=1798224 RepID=UPI00087C64E7|nr:glycosyltransferase family 4 protein [Jiangella sp. DSM 45060]SDT05846.1 Phosphatidylinositol alpha-mannosyltransferase [Jiangella sp. DSM 45060]
MKVGIACPYSWDVPGGVQVHIRDFTEELTSRGHKVSVLAPGDDDDDLPPYVTTVGRPLAIPYNGSVARVAFGPRIAARVRRWLVDGDFDVVHVHEPASLSLGLITTLWAEVPIVATSHSAMRRSRAMSAAQGILKSAFEKFTAHIAVSEEARRTVVQHLGVDAVLIPNGLFVDRFAVPAREEWRSEEGTLSFLGRLDEPRKGLQVLLKAWPAIHDAFPKTRLLVAGRGEIEDIRRGIDPRYRDAVEFLGGVSDDDKAAMLASSDIYVAPHIGGESFGIVLAEAMAAGAPVLSSDLEAFQAVLDGGRLGALMPVGDSSALADEAIALLGDPARRARYRAAASLGVRRYDWSRVADEVLAVYEMAVAVGSGGHTFKLPGLP